MMNEAMTAERVLELIGAYGADPLDWPEAERAAGLALIQDDPARFESALAHARGVDMLLAGEPDIEPSSGLAEAILAAAPREHGRTPSLLQSLATLFIPSGARIPAGAVLGSLAIGLASGYAYASSGSGVAYDELDAAYDAAFTGSDTSLWVLAEDGDDG